MRGSVRSAKWWARANSWSAVMAVLLGARWGRGGLPQRGASHHLPATDQCFLMVLRPCPDDELLGGGLAGVGEAVGLVGGEGLADVLVGHRTPPQRLRFRSQDPQSLRFP